MSVISDWAANQGVELWNVTDWVIHTTIKVLGECPYICLQKPLRIGCTRCVMISSPQVGHLHRYPHTDLCVCLHVHTRVCVCLCARVCVHVCSVSNLLGRPLRQLVNANILSANHVAATKCIKACWCGQEVQLSFRPKGQNGKKWLWL